MLDGDLVYVDVTQHRIKRIAGGVATGAVTTILGNGVAGFASFSLPGDGRLNFPAGLVQDPLTGDLYVTEHGADAVVVRIGP